MAVDSLLTACSQLGSWAHIVSFPVSWRSLFLFRQGDLEREGLMPKRTSLVSWSRFWFSNSCGHPCYFALLLKLKKPVLLSGFPRDAQSIQHAHQPPGFVWSFLFSSALFVHSCSPAEGFLCSAGSKFVTLLLTQSLWAQNCPWYSFTMFSAEVHGVLASVADQQFPYLIGCVSLIDLVFLNFT